MTRSGSPAQWKVVVAFSMIYFVWGSTYLAIRVGVEQMPPFLMAGLRFTAAGLAMYLWMRIAGTPSPSWTEWKGATLLGALMFLLDYACLFWAEQRIPSGIAAVILAMIPVCITLLEVFVLRTQALGVRLVAGLVVGILGVAVLANPWASLGEAPLDHRGVIALLVACCGWSAGTIVSKRLMLPASKPMSAAAQMLTGGIQLLILAGESGEVTHFHAGGVSLKAWFALIYLIIAGSIVAFTAYVWLLDFQSPTRVGTYAYVNPVVAVVLGALLGGEKVGPRTILGTVLILIGVAAITTAKAGRGVRPNLREASRVTAD